jgi:uroporphyrinogen decarboxylase
MQTFIPVTVYGPWESAWRHHGFEDSLMDLIAEPEMMGEMFERITDLTIATVQKMMDIGCKPDAIWLTEDMGGTRTTLFSPKTYRELLFPCHKKLGDFLHAHGIYFFMHSCGYIEPLLPDLVEAGLNVIQALQANTGMHVADLKRKFGDKLTFFGNISEQNFKKGKEAIEAELRDKIPAAMEGGGYIYHSDHSIPPEVTLETYLYAMKVLDEIGTYK